MVDLVEVSLKISSRPLDQW